MPFAALSVAATLIFNNAAIPAKPIACAYDQLNDGERMVMGQVLALDIASPSAAGNPDKLKVQKDIIAKMGSCPGIDTMPDRRLALTEEYTESRLLHDYADRALGVTKDGGSMIDALLDDVPAGDRQSLAGVFGNASAGEAAAVFKRAMTLFQEDHPLSRKQADLLAMGVTAQLGMNAVEQAW